MVWARLSKWLAPSWCVLLFELDLKGAIYVKRRIQTLSMVPRNLNLSMHDIFKASALPLKLDRDIHLGGISNNVLS